MGLGGGFMGRQPAQGQGPNPSTPYANYQAGQNGGVHGPSGVPVRNEATHQAEIEDYNRRQAQPATNEQGTLPFGIGRRRSWTR